MTIRIKIKISQLTKDGNNKKIKMERRGPDSDLKK